jgi:acetyltransferase-like isoleucine patch superfamily enzyme
MDLKAYIQQHPGIKKWLYHFIMHPVKTRPNWWIRLFQPLYIKKGKGAVIYRSVRKDLTPFHSFSLGRNSVIEDYSCINNAVGAIHVGEYTRIGLHNTIIGPVSIGNHVNLAQNVVVSGLNHNFQDPDIPIDRQGISTSLVTIGDDIWIGANTTIIAGVSIGKHSVIGAGSVVTKDIPDYCVAVGNPARVIKRYNFHSNIWEKVI